jgi:glycosyltransferase involved in cell wall biosynthesis
MKIFLSSARFAPSYGGPAYSVRKLAEHLAATGLSVAVWAPDGSAVTDSPRSDADGSAQTGAMPQSLGGTLASALHEFGTPDVLHDSGLWWRHNRAIASAARRLATPLVISLRGMLEPAALRHHAWRKFFAWRLYQKRNLDHAAALHATGHLEADNARTLALRPEIVCIPNGLTVPRVCPVRNPAQQKSVVFLGRLHPIKGLPMLLEAWARVRPSDWTLEIAGPDEGGHRQILEAQVNALAIDGSVHFSGPVIGMEKRSLMARASVCVLPSHSENFGLAVGEALAEGVPVIATKGTPWEALETEGCGWHVATSVDGLEAGLRAAFATDPGRLVAMGRSGHAYVARAFSWSNVADRMADLYRRIVSSRADFDLARAVT